jgi:hypothetical protein
VSIEIGPGPRGVATIYDKEVLLYRAHPRGLAQEP